MGCAPEFDSTRRVGWSGTLGEEIYKVVCQRMADEASRAAHEADPSVPYDVSGEPTRALCEGAADPSTAPTARLRVLAENRDRLVAALDATLPEAMEDDLEAFMLRLLPFYDPPLERFPTQTREVADLLTHLMNDRDAVEAFERIGGRDGFRPLFVALGTAKPALSWPGLREFLDVSFDVIGEGGAAHDPWLEMLEATALEMATTVPDAPGEITTRDVARELVLAEHADFAAGTPLHLPRRDRRGLPIPTALEPPFVDMDLDGLADANERGQFVDASGVPLDVPTPFPVVGEGPFDRDGEGRALKADLTTPLYQFLDVDRTLLAGISRELLPLVDPTEETLLDFVYGLRTMVGGDTASTEQLGAIEHAYTGLDTANGPLFDVVHSVSVMLAQDEMLEVLDVAEVLMQPQYEPILGALIESGLVAQANGDLDPAAVMTPDQELWDSLLELATIMAEDGILEDVLRVFTLPETARMGQILAELMRHKDVPNVDPVALRSMPRLSNDLYDEEVIRETPGGSPVREWAPGSMVEPYPSHVPNNASLFHQSMSVIHELVGAQFCNKEGATMNDAGLGAALGLSNFWANAVDTLLEGALALLFPDGFGECQMLNIDNLVYAYAQSITGDLYIELDTATWLGQLLDLLNTLGFSFLTDPLLSFILETGTGIPGLGVRPDPVVMNRLVFGTPTQFTQNLMDPAVTRYGDVIVDRYDPIVLAWEREFCFDGEQLVETWPCDPPLVKQGFFEALVPLLEVLNAHYENNPGRPHLFGMIADAVMNDWTSPADTMYQSSDPNGPRYVRRSNGISYEALTADMIADCGWDAVGPGRTCDTDRSAQFMSRFVEMMQALDGIEVSAGRDGIDVLADAAAQMAVPALNPGLTNRQGEATTWTNAGLRELPMTPLYLLLDSLNAMDAAFAADPDATRHERWLAARSRLVDRLMLTVPSGDGYILENRRVHALLEVLLPFLQERFDEHDALGDRVEWALGLDDRFEASMGSAIGSGIFRTVDAIQSSPAAREQLNLLAEYLTDELGDDDAFPATVLAIADLLQWMEDDANVPVILNALAEGVALNAKRASLGDGVLDPASGSVNRTIDFLQDVNEADVDSTLATILANSVALPPGAEETPLEVLLDVIAEINRAAPGQGDQLAADDYEEVFQNTIEFLTDEYRGLERLYDVVQNRELP